MIRRPGQKAPAGEFRSTGTGKNGRGRGREGENPRPFAEMVFRGGIIWLRVPLAVFVVGEDHLAVAYFRR
jgi:hypothetical protein